MLRISAAKQPHHGAKKRQLTVTSRTQASAFCLLLLPFGSFLHSVFALGLALAEASGPSFPGRALALARISPGAPRLSRGYSHGWTLTLERILTYAIAADAAGLGGNGGGNGPLPFGSLHARFPPSKSVSCDFLQLL